MMQVTTNINILQHGWLTKVQFLKLPVQYVEGSADLTGFVLL